MPRNFDAVGPLFCSQKQDLADLFELFDTDGGGTLDADEIKIALLTLGYLNTTEEEETIAQPALFP